MSASSHPAFGQVDLSNCDREPIHVPGSIQPHGALLVLDPAADFTVVQVAGDTAALLAKLPEAMLGKPLADLFGSTHVEALEEILAHGDASTPLHALDPDLRLGDVPVDASVHRTVLTAGPEHPEGREVVVVEFEAADTPKARSRDPLSAVQRMLSAIHASTDLHTFCQTATEQLRRLTGYDRVMVYRFLPQGEGWVFAESHKPGMPPYLELRYPASDIPAQARLLYLRNWLRIIADVDYTPAPLLAAGNGAAADNAMLDMSQCVLRSVSPLHLEYLRNMGVAATMTISVIRGGQLWGLIACHHETPKPIPRHLRAMCELFGHMFSFQLEARERAEGYEYRHKLRGLHERLVRFMSDEPDLAAGLMRQRQNLLDYIDADGVALLVEDQFSSLGRTPREDHMRALVDWLDRTHGDQGVFATASLSSHWEFARDFAIDASGVIAIAASRSPRDYIIWFRPEVIESVRWAGNPDKPVEAGEQGERISPRKSFEAYSRSVRLHAKPWTEAEIEAVQTLRLTLLEVILKRIDQIARERGAAQARHEVMLAELNHRVKNTLATIQALARHSKRSAASLDAYVHGFEQRIQAMAASHNLLTDTAWEAVDLRTLLVEQLRPYATEGDNLRLNGPRVALLPKTGTSIGMAVHELATNAAKYGALSVPGGCVQVHWSVTGSAPSRILAMSWREVGGPQVKLPTRQGFGSFVTQRFVTYETQGRSKVHYDPDGVRCEIEVPEDALALTSGQGDGASANGQVEEDRGDETRVLIVEDEALVALVVEEAVHSLGWMPVGPVGRVDAALSLLRTEGDRLHGAVLDINLAEMKVWPVAEALQDRGVPFLFATGYDRSRGLIPPRFANIPVLGKPLVEQQLMDALQRMMAQDRVGRAVADLRDVRS